MNRKYIEYYNRIISPIINSSPSVTIDDDTYNKIREHAIKRAEYKKREYDHIIDNDREVERTITGLMGEAAVEKLLGLDIIDWSIGKSSRYNTPDIKGYHVGIKTVEVGKYPIIFKKNTYPQIICVRDTRDNKKVYVCGLAPTNILNKFQSDDLILSWKLKAKGYKTGFWGFKQLKNVNSVSDLKEDK